MFLSLDRVLHIPLYHAISIRFMIMWPQFIWPFLFSGVHCPILALLPMTEDTSDSLKRGHSRDARYRDVYCVCIVNMNVDLKTTTRTTDDNHDNSSISKFVIYHSDK